MKKTVALFLADPYCSVQSGNGIMKSLGNNYNFKIFGKNVLEDNFFDDVDIVAVPGGFGDASSFDRLFQLTLLEYKSLSKVEVGTLVFVWGHIGQDNIILTY